MRPSSRLLGVLWRWHRRVGVVAAASALMLSLTGIVLNHSSELGLDRAFLDWPWLNRAYGDDSAQLPAFQPGQYWVFRAANGLVYLNTTEVAPCSGGLVGALQLEGLIVAACAEELLLITPAGELVEAISTSVGLPAPVLGVGLLGNDLALQTSSGWWQANLDTIDFTVAAPVGALIQQHAPGELPDALRAGIPAPQAWLSWERLLLDIHSGRVAGPIGVVVIDAMGLALAVLAVSGLVMWWLHRRRSGSRQR